jgi:hypothetical protein
VVGSDASWSLFVPETVLYDLTAGIRGAPALFLGEDGAFRDAAGPAPSGLAAATALVRAARWISSRRRLTFEQLYPASPFSPGVAALPGRLRAAQVPGLLTQVRSALDAAAVSGPAAAADATGAAQLRSACVTVLSHVVATVRRDPTFRPHADTAVAWILGVIDAETGPNARPALRSHAIQLLQLRGPCLAPADAARATALLRGLVRAAPPYETLPATWRFAMCSAWDFNEGECEVLVRVHGFQAGTAPDDSPVPQSYRYRVLRAPFTTPKGGPVEIWARTARPEDENEEMGSELFVGLLVNRHAQLGSFDMRASLTPVVQRGYKLMMNGQCAGLTTRFAISRLFPDADIYSSWDSTYFRTGDGGKVSASEAVDCFVAILQGMAHGETHAAIDRRIRGAQWHHEQATTPGFVQFVGPSHPEVLARYTDLNQDGKADRYDGFLDLDLHAIAEDLRASATPRDPGAAATQIGGTAARGLNWAAGSLNRVTQYSDLWSALPGQAEGLYAFQSGGFFSQLEPPADLPARPLLSEPGRQPALCRYTPVEGSAAGMSVDVMFHSWLAHGAMEYKRLLCAAEAFWAALDAGVMPATGAFATLEGQRGAVLLTLAGLLEFPADQNWIDGLWSLALQELGFPDVSRSVVRGCITDADHAADNYYGSLRGLRQLLGGSDQPGALTAADPVAAARLRAADPAIGRARPLAV